MGYFNMGNRKILIRFDDICPTMNYVQFQKALTIMQQYDVKPLLGVIPDCQDQELQIEKAHDDFWEYMRSLQKKGYKLAMHGYQHVYDNKYRGVVNMGCRSEFAGHSYKEQLEKIEKGKEILHQHGIDTDIFFAPAHSYDWCTLRALAECGFKYVSDGMSRKPIIRYGITSIPCRSAGVPKITKKGYYTAVFHVHEWVRPEKAYGYEQLVKLCKTYGQDIVGFDEFNDRNGKCNIFEKLDEWIYVRFHRYIRPLLSKIKHNVFKR